MSKIQGNARSNSKRNLYLAIVAVSVLVIAIVCGLVVAFWPNPEDDLVGFEEIQNAAEEIYMTSNGNIDEVTKFFERRGKKAETQEAKDELALIEMAAYLAVGDAGQSITASEQLNLENLTEEQQATYCGILVNAYTNDNNSERAAYYLAYLVEHNLLDSDGEG